MSFDLRHLRYALTAAEHRSFFRAALELEIEQSSMSRAINRLEARLGVKLFKRSHAGISLTRAGAEFVRAARQILAKSDELIGAMQSAGQGRVGRFAIGHCHSVPARRLEEILLGQRQLLMDIEVERVEGSRELLIVGLEAQVIDIAILPGDRSVAGMLQSHLWTEELMQRQISFSAYWHRDNDNAALREFLAYVYDRDECTCESSPGARRSLGRVA